MTLYNQKQFAVDSHGAYLTRLQDDTGRPIVFEQIIIEGKRRGGAHVCLPYFGADSAEVLPQHGFGRDVEWHVEVISDAEVICTYEEMEDELFKGLSARLIYRLREPESTFSTELLIENKGSGAFPVSPGFHPYFAVNPSDVQLDGRHVDLADFEPFKEFPQTHSMTVASGGHNFTVHSENLGHMVAWTNLQGDYLCVEPTESGHSFSSTGPARGVLQPGEKAVYSYTISWA